MAMLPPLGAQELIVLLGLGSSVTAAALPHLPRLGLTALSVAWAVVYAAAW